MRHHTWLVIALAACTAPARVPSTLLSAQQHYAEARRHDAEADEHDRAARADERVTAQQRYCADRAIAEQSTSGGVPISLVTPCWTSTASDRESHLHRAADLRRDARAHRSTAAKLIAAERAACDRLPVAERDHSPSWHRDDIIGVETVYAGHHVVGARLVFRKVEGLSVDWLRAAYACHHAQAAAAGYDPTYMPYCPAGLPDVAIDVVERSDGYVVTFRSSVRDDTGPAILGRAEALTEREK